jgi:antitoxin component YwqK of YwqJK toxin-antitoxin module
MTQKTLLISLLGVNGAILGVIIFAVREPKIEATDSRIRWENGQALFKEHPFTGMMIERNLNHDLLARVHYQLGKKEGYSFTYHHDGTRVAENHYHVGLKEGQQESWYADGKHRSTSYFRHGIAEGTYTEWHPNGKIYRLQKIQDGIELENKIFYESGVIYSNYVVRNQRTFGIQGEPLCNTVKQEGFK